MDKIDQINYDQQPKKRIFVASLSSIKLEAVKVALGDVDVVSIESQSLIAEQPIGMSEIVKGAENRLETSLKNGATGVIFAIENGLVKGQELVDFQISVDAMDEALDSNAWYDLAVVIVDDASGYRGKGLSKGVKVPQHLVDGVLSNANQTITVGKLLAEEHPEVNHQDPQYYLTGGMVGRLQLMSEAVREAQQDLMDQKSS